MTSRLFKPALLIWLAAMLASVLVISQTRFVADLSAFMPKLPSARQQMLIDQLRDGAIARLVLVGIEGADEAERGRLSRLLVGKLASNPRFAAVQNGDSQTQQHDQQYFFNNRYLLSPAVTPQRFTAGGLHDTIQDTLLAMSGDAGLIVKKILPRDPTGETLQILEQFMGESQPSTSNDIWVSRDGKRAVLLLQLAEKDGTVLLPSREDIGALLGITTEHASRTVSELKRMDAIFEVSGNRFRCDLDELSCISAAQR